MIEEAKQAITERFLEAEDYIEKKYKIKKQSAFADTIGASNQHISNIKGKRSHVNAWMIAAMIKTYEEINPDYILNGEGQLLRPSDQEKRTMEVMEKFNEALQAEVAFLKKQLDYLQTLIPKEEEESTSE